MLNVKPFHQTMEGYCGPAALKMVLEYFNIAKTEEDLVKITNCDAHTGITGEQILTAAVLCGLKGEVKNFAELEDIKKYVHEQKIPVIVDWFCTDEGHYSVVVDIDSENIYLEDPSIGHIRALSLTVFKRVWFDFADDVIYSKDGMIIRQLIAIHP